MGPELEKWEGLMTHVVSVCEETMMNHSRPSTLLYASVAARRRMQVLIWVFRMEVLDQSCGLRKGFVSSG